MNRSGGRKVKLFKIGFILNYPNEEGRKVDFGSKIKDIEDVILITNSNYRGIKEIKLLEVEKQEIHLLFCIFQEDDNFKMNGRHLSFFSKRLYETGWDRYTSIPSKLFKTSYVIDVTEEYKETYESISYIPNNKEKKLYQDVKGQLLSNEDALKLFRQLCEIQGIGDEETKSRNNEILNSIKSILFNWIK